VLPVHLAHGASAEITLELLGRHALRHAVQGKPKLVVRVSSERRAFEGSDEDAFVQQVFKLARHAAEDWPDLGIPDPADEPDSVSISPAIFFFFFSLMSYNTNTTIFFSPAIAWVDPHKTLRRHQPNQTPNTFMPFASVESALTAALAAGLAWRLSSVGWEAEAGAILVPCGVAMLAPSVAAAHGASPRICSSDGVVLGCTVPGVVLGALAYARLRVSEPTGPLRAYCWASSLCSVLAVCGLSLGVAPWVAALALAVPLGVGLGLSTGECYAVLAILAAFGVLYSLALRAVRQCFTYGEAATVASLGAILLVDSALLTLCGSGAAQGALLDWQVPLCLARLDGTSAAQVALAGVLLLVCVLGAALRQLGTAPRAAAAPRRMLAFYLLTLAGALLILSWMGVAARLPIVPEAAALLSVWGSWAQHIASTVVWLLHFATGERGLCLMAYWLFVLVLGVVFAWRLAPDGKPSAGAGGATSKAGGSVSGRLAAAAAQERQHDRARQLVSRKVYHLVAVALFAPAAATQLPFLQLALAAVLGIFALLEAMRVGKIPPFGIPIQRLCERFIDSRDGGSLVLTHQYLLAGCAIPLLLAPALPPAAASPSRVEGADDDTQGGLGLMGNLGPLQLAAPLAGVLVLGVGDAIAAVVGVRFGRTRWPGNFKTVEGTLAAVLSMLAVLFALQVAIGWAVHHDGAVGTAGLGQGLARREYGDPGDWARVACCTIFVCLLEAFTEQIDNLYLPLAYLAALQAVAPLHRDLGAS